MVGAGSSMRTAADLYDSNKNWITCLEIIGSNTQYGTSQTIYVKKGLYIQVAAVSSNGSVKFYPFV